ncbi:hypothetical protein NDU88_006233 [Pleurodeles waltl]|uniref:Uncharacterized protein n=1 Tax=Pleurodeles waltl TaxID=8319 RepID=A0AAV7L5A2_PLEWA|nr:hypothetical protein NDU88_006233 [Pleurodeles waltl]
MPISRAAARPAKPEGMPLGPVSLLHGVTTREEARPCLCPAVVPLGPECAKLFRECPGSCGSAQAPAGVPRLLRVVQRGRSRSTVSCQWTRAAPPGDSIITGLKNPEFSSPETPLVRSASHSKMRSGKSGAKQQASVSPPRSSSAKKES